MAKCLKVLKLTLAPQVNPYTPEWRRKPYFLKLSSTSILTVVCEPRASQEPGDSFSHGTTALAWIYF